MPLTVTVTSAGRAALRNAQGDGSSAVRIASVGLSAASFMPGEALPNEIKRLKTIAGGATSADTIHVTVSDSAIGAVYTVRGFGLYLDDGTLFASYGQTDPIVEKSGQAFMLLAVDIQFADVDAAHITFGDTTFQNPAATTEMLGVVKLATSEEAKAGRDTQKVLTPATSLAATNARFGASAPSDYVKGLLALASNSEFLNAIGPTFPPAKHAHTLDEVAGLAAALAAKLDARSRYVPGQIIVTAGQQAPPCTLLCNGAAVSRTQYGDLFAAIGTTYGAGDGATTFNVPRLGEGTVIKATVDASKIGTYSAGALLTHTHGATAAAAGDHAHSASLTAAGSHNHGASASGVGDHAHATWTDGQGNHAHSGTTGGQSADHSHSLPNVFHTPGGNAQYSGGGGNYFGVTSMTTSGSSNDHVHGFSTDWQGNHGHNIGMNGAGAHSHTISIASVGDHTHGVSLANGGSHAHTLTIAAAGGSDNLAAGTHMFHFIAY